MSLTSLPLEILVPIAARLPVADILALASASSYTRAILSFPSLWTTLDFADASDSFADDEFDAFLAKIAAWIAPALDVPLADAVEKIHAQITALVFDGTGISARKAATVVRSMPALRRLSLRNCTATRDHHSLDRDFLRAASESESDHPPPPPRLTHLDFSSPIFGIYGPPSQKLYLSLASTVFPNLVQLRPSLCTTCSTLFTAQDSFMPHVGRPAIPTATRDAHTRCWRCIIQSTCADCKTYHPNTSPETNFAPLIPHKCLRCGDGGHSRRCPACSTGWTSCIEKGCRSETCPKCVSGGNDRCPQCGNGPFCGQHRQMCHYGK